MPTRVGTPGQTKDMLERLYLLAGLGMFWCGSGWGEEHLELPAQAVAPAAENETTPYPPLSARFLVSVCEFEYCTMVLNYNF